MPRRSDPFDLSSLSAGAASSSPPTSVPPHPGLARAWANSQRGQPGQLPDMHLGHPETPTAQHPLAQHQHYGAGGGCGCATPRLCLLTPALVVVTGGHTHTTVLAAHPSVGPQHALARSGTARTRKSCTATPLRPSTRAARCSIRRGQQLAQRGPTATSTACSDSCMRSASQQAGGHTAVVTSPHRPLVPAPTPTRVPMCGRRARQLARSGVLRSGGRRAVGQTT